MTTEASFAPTRDLSRPPSPSDAPEWYSRCCADLSKSTRTKTRIGAMRATLVDAARLWDNGSTLTYTFVQPAGTSIQQNKVKTVIKEWEKCANIKFQHTTSRNATIRISFYPPEGNFSYLGKDNLQIPRNQRTMNLGDVSSRQGISEGEKGVILHEFGHALGYHHEHQNSRRGEKLTLDEQAVIVYYGSIDPLFDEATVREQILNLLNDDEVSNFSAVDLTSIMMYPMPAQLNLERIEIPWNNNLSLLDKAFAFLNYPFFPGNPRSADITVNIDNAIATVGIQDDFKDIILSEYREGDWEGVRAEFTRWSLNEKAKAVAAKIRAKAAEEVGGKEATLADANSVPIAN